MEAESVVTEAKQTLPGKFVHEGKTLGVRSLRQDYTSYQGFANPIEIGAEVFAPDWSNIAECGKGLHFIPWGIGHDGQEHGFDKPVWQVIEPIGEIVTLEGKCKSHGLRIVHTGTLSECMALTHSGRTAFIESIAEKSSTGYSSSAASTGDCTAAISTGPDSKAKAGAYSCIALAGWIKVDEDTRRLEMRCAEIGIGDGTDGKLKANIWYRIDDSGSFVEAS